MTSLFAGAPYLSPQDALAASLFLWHATDADDVFCRKVTDDELALADACTSQVLKQRQRQWEALERVLPFFDGYGAFDWPDSLLASAVLAHELVCLGWFHRVEDLEQVV